METVDIPKILFNIQPDLESIEDQASKKAVSVLLNLVELSVAENKQLKRENQQLKDEMNHLKGEQGKPDIKPNKNKGRDISSEQERKQAEETSNQEGFKLNESSLEKLREQRLPGKLLEQLTSISGQKYSSEEEFIHDVESVIGKKLTEQYRTLLIKYARYKKRNRQPKIPEITIHRYERCLVDKTQLPDDVEKKGYEKKVVQDVIIRTENVEFEREVYYSPSLRKTYTGEIPTGYEGDFGPHINADIISMKYVNGMTNPKIVEFYRNIGVLISGSYISNRLTKPKSMEVFHSEKSEVHRAALEVSSYIQMDDTGSRVNGKNHYTQIVCNALYTAFFTTKRKNRLTILDILQNFGSKSFLINEQTFFLLEQLGVCKTDISLLSKHQQATSYSENEIFEILRNIYGSDGNPRKRTKIMEACAIASYRQETDVSAAKVLVADDAPQFKLLTDELALCWVHEGRHYKRLGPVVPLHQAELSHFLQQFWAYYRQLFRYKKNPSDQRAVMLDTEFDTLFSTKTSYAELNDRIAKSKQKKNALLVVLKHPEVPLHNNRSENGARVEKRRQDISLQTKTAEGTKAKDTMMSIVETCKKLNVSAYKFIYDRVNRKFEIPSLAKMIRDKVVAKSIPP